MATYTRTYYGNSQPKKWREAEFPKDNFKEREVGGIYFNSFVGDGKCVHLFSSFNWKIADADHSEFFGLKRTICTFLYQTLRIDQFWVDMWCRKIFTYDLNPFCADQIINLSYKLYVDGAINWIIEALFA